MEYLKDVCVQMRGILAVHLRNSNNEHKEYNRGYLAAVYVMGALSYEEWKEAEIFLRGGRSGQHWWE